MKVKCIKEVEEWRVCRDVTIGEKYKVLKEEEYGYLLIDNTGHKWRYDKDCFKVEKKKYTKKQLIKLIKDNL